MNKEELKEKTNSIKGAVIKGMFIEHLTLIDKERVIELIDQLDKPEKVVVPQFVAEWYEE